MKLLSKLYQRSANLNHYNDKNDCVQNSIGKGKVNNSLLKSKYDVIFQGTKKKKPCLQF